MRELASNCLNNPNVFGLYNRPNILIIQKIKKVIFIYNVISNVNRGSNLPLSRLLFSLKNEKETLLWILQEQVIFWNICLILFSVIFKSSFLLKIVFCWSFGIVVC